MKKLVALIALLQLLALPSVAGAQDYAGARLVSKTSWVEEWDPASESWVRIESEPTAVASPVATITTHIVNGEVVSQAETAHHAVRYAQPWSQKPQPVMLGQYGPFRVIDGKRAAMVGATDASSPAHFDAMLRDHPGIEVLEMVDAPGTNHDIANLAVGRRIRAAGIATHVPNGGSVRSGAVELFLAGDTRTKEPGAQFAVHSWMDNYGREPDDFAADAPENRLYLDYYVEMGMSETRARDFYAMTNSVPHAGALWLQADDMAPWIAPERGELPQVRMASRTMERPVIAWLEEAGSPAPFPILEVEPIEPVFSLALSPMIDYRDLSHVTLARAEISRVGAY